MFTSNNGESKPVDQHIEIKQVINQIYENNGTSPGTNVTPTKKQVSSPENKNAAIKYEKIGRNVQCPCGSGLKYKRCHGDTLKKELTTALLNK